MTLSIWSKAIADGFTWAFWYRSWSWQVGDDYVYTRFIVEPFYGSVSIVQNWCSIPVSIVCSTRATRRNGVRMSRIVPLLPCAWPPRLWNFEGTALMRSFAGRRTHGHVFNITIRSRRTRARGGTTAYPTKRCRSKESRVDSKLQTRKPTILHSTWSVPWSTDFNGWEYATRLLWGAYNLREKIVEIDQIQLFCQSIHMWTKFSNWMLVSDFVAAFHGLKKLITTPFPFPASANDSNFVFLDLSLPCVDPRQWSIIMR
jgi:hypothetical protein